MRKSLLFVLLVLVGCAPSLTTDHSVTAITNVTLLDGRGGPGIPGATVLVSNGRISRIETRRARLPQRVQLLEGQGGYLLPGFIDMHAHLLVPRCKAPGGSKTPFDRAVSERMLGVLLDFGITTIRSPGNPSVEGIALRDDLNARQVRGPRAMASAEIISNPQWDEEKLRSYVRDAMPLKPDYFKVYGGLPPSSVAIVIDEAHKFGIPVIGHMQRTSWPEAVGLGIDHVTHGFDWHASMLRPGKRAQYEKAVEEKTGLRARVDWMELVDPDSPEVAAMIEAVAESGVSVDPTLVAYDSKFLDPSEDRYRRNPNVDVVPEMHADWRACMTVTKDWTAEDYSRWRAAWPKGLAITRKMHERGVLLTTGTDITNPFVIPGESLHQEFELLGEAGIPPLAILKMTGANAAKALGRSDLGIVASGRRADLVLLTADPRSDIRNTRRIAWVMKDGRIVARRHN